MNQNPIDPDEAAYRQWHAERAEDIYGLERSAFRDGIKYARTLPPAPAALEIAMKAAWQRDYPNGGRMVKTWEDNTYQDREIYRKEVAPIVSALLPIKRSEPVAWRTRDLTGAGWVVFATLEKAEMWIRQSAPQRSLSCIEALTVAAE